MERQIITVDIIPGGGQPQRLKMTQGDIGRPLGVYVMRGGVALDCSAYTADLYVLKPDGNYYTITATVDTTKTNLIYWDTGEQETPVAGDCAAQIRITQNGDDIGTARFVEFVEASPGFVGEASQSVVESLMEYVREAAASAQTAGDAAGTATGAATTATNAKTAAETAQGKAETAQEKAEAAQEAAEDAAEAAEDVKNYLDLHYTDLAADVTDLKTAKAPCVYESASGAIASFSDGADGMPMRSVEVAIEPVQDLHGYDSPWPGGGSKNLCPPITLPLTSGTVLREFPEEITLTALSLQFRFSGSFSNIGGSFLIGKDANGTSTFAITLGYMKKVSDNTTPIANTTYNNEAVAFSTTSLGASGKLKQILFYNYPSFTDGVFTDLMLEDSATPTTYAPYSNICPITGHSSATVTRTGKNLLNVNNWEVDEGCPITIENGKMTVERSGYQESKNRYVLPSTDQMTISFHVKTTALNNASASFRLNADGVPIVPSQGASAAGNIYLESVGHEVDVIATLSGKHYISFGGWSYEGTVEISNIQLELGSTVHSYEPYQGVSVTIPLGQTVYGGTLDAVAGTLTVDRACVDLGDQDWVMSEGRFYATLDNMKVPATTADRKTGIISSMYKVSSATVAANMGDYEMLRISGKIYIRNDSYSTKETFKAGMAGVQLCYELATPVVIENLTVQQIQTLLGVNNIWADTGTVNVEYPADTKLYIDTKLAELQALILENI